MIRICEPPLRVCRSGASSKPSALRKILQMSWQQVYQDKGLNWEKIKSRPGPAGQALYSFRISQKIRGVACRDGDFMRVLAIHEDHDSAYK